MGIAVKNSSGTTICELHKVKYTGAFMGEETVTSTIYSSTPIAFSPFDYIAYRGNTYTLDYLATVEKKSRSGSAGDAFTYDLTFYSFKYELERCLFRDYVEGFDTNPIKYPQPYTITFTGTASYLINRIKYCMDKLYTGDKAWTFVVPSEYYDPNDPNAAGEKINLMAVEKNVSIDKQSCWNSLSKVYSDYGVPYSISGRTVTFGESTALNYTFKYGKGNGLYSIKRTASSDEGIVTRLIPYGSDRNITGSYDKASMPVAADEVACPDSQYLPYLMLSSYRKSGRVDYIESSNVSVYGVREATIQFSDVYPSITQVKGLDASSATVDGDTIRIGSGTTDEKKDTFDVYTQYMPFKLTDCLTTNDPVMSMKTGNLIGYEFEVTAIDETTTLTSGSTTYYSWKLTLKKYSSDSVLLPTTEIPMSAGDKFVLLYIDLPKEYILSAENTLLARAKQYLAKYDHTNYSYSISIDNINAQRLKDAGTFDLYSNIAPGMKMTIQDDDLGTNDSVVIQSLSITEGESLIPEFEVTLNNQVSASTLDRIQGNQESQEVTNVSTANSLSAVINQLRNLANTFSKYWVLITTDAQGNAIPSSEYHLESSYDAIVHDNLSALGSVSAGLKSTTVPLSPLAGYNSVGMARFDNAQFGVDADGLVHVLESAVGTNVDIIKTTDSTSPTDSNVYSAAKIDSLLSGITGKPSALWLTDGSATYLSYSTTDPDDNTAVTFATLDGALKIMQYLKVAGKATIGGDETVAGNITSEKTISAAGGIHAGTKDTNIVNNPIAGYSAIGMSKYSSTDFTVDADGTVHSKGTTTSGANVVAQSTQPTSPTDGLIWIQTS